MRSGGNAGNNTPTGLNWNKTALIGLRFTHRELVMAERLLSIRTVSERTSLSRSEIYRRVKLGTFPRQVKIGVRRVAWPERDVDFWCQAQYS